jgi:hypothetical protein
MLISPQSAEKRQRYLVNWLVIRWFWICRITTDPPSSFPKPQFWQDVLNTSDDKSSGPSNKVATHSASSKSNAFDIVGEECKVLIQYNQPNVSWREQDYSVGTFLNPPLHIIRGILWELYELSFIFELRALDQVLLLEAWKKYSRERKAQLDGLYPIVYGKRFWEQDTPKRSGTLSMTDAVEDN